MGEISIEGLLASAPERRNIQVSIDSPVGLDSESLYLHTCIYIYT